MENYIVTNHCSYLVYTTPVGEGWETMVYLAENGEVADWRGISKYTRLSDNEYQAQRKHNEVTLLVSKESQIKNHCRSLKEY